MLFQASLAFLSLSYADPQKGEILKEKYWDKLGDWD